MIRNLALFGKDALTTSQCFTMGWWLSSCLLVGSSASPQNFNQRSCLSLVAPLPNWNKLFSQGWAKSIAAQALIDFLCFFCPSGISMQSPEHAQAAQDTHGPRTQKGHMRQRKGIRSFRVRWAKSIAAQAPMDFFVFSFAP